MKIAIVTFVHAYNYGAELQCFALQYKLRNQGFNVEVLDLYRPQDDEYRHTKDSDLKFGPLFSHNSSSDRKARIHRIAADWIACMQKIFYRKRFIERKKAFWGFHEEYTNLSPQPICNFLALYQQNFDYTHYIVGSDQVWNYSNGFSVEPYLLSFVDNAKKISYAASIGHSDIPSQISEIYLKNLSSFRAISLREEQGTKIISEITKRNDVVTVLDPTLLLSKEEWENALRISKSPCKPYLLLYLLSRSCESVDFAIEYAKKRDWDVKIISTSIVPQYKYNNIQYICGVSPKQFVELFCSASFVVTNSFHGTAFAVNFNIPFISTTRSDKRYNSRFVNLLNITGLSSRLVFEDKLDYSRLDNLEACDFSTARTSIEDERSKSLDFILKALA